MCIRDRLNVVEKLEAGGQLETFTLKTCTDLGKTLIHINDSVQKMEEGDGRSRALVMRMNDVKSMFTALPRDEILKAVDSLFELAQQQKWGRRGQHRLIIVPKAQRERKTLTRITSSMAVPDRDIHYAFTFQQIKEVLIWDRCSFNCREEGTCLWS